jgi:gamma-glutamylcyclotransferase
MNEWYFAYGSNLWIDQMIERTGPIRQGADAPKVARLDNFRLVFNMHGGDGDGQVFANIMPPGEAVLGVVYRCSPEALKALDAYEEGYERGHVQVVLENGEKRDAVTYFAKPAHVSNCARPSAEYLQRILDGARQHGLPDEYIRGLEARANAD